MITRSVNEFGQTAWCERQAVDEIAGEIALSRDGRYKSKPTPFIVTVNFSFIWADYMYICHTCMCTPISTLSSSTLANHTFS